MSPFLNLFNSLAIAGALLVFGCKSTRPKAIDSGAEASVDCEQLFFADADGDGFGDPTETQSACTAPPGFVDNANDCDDNTDAISPSKAERCDGIDNNCDGHIDEDAATDAVDWFSDADGDGFGFGPPRGFGCTGETDEVSNHTDCDDNADFSHPDATERCDGMDNDCDGDIDEGETPDGQQLFADVDGDNWGDATAESFRCALSDGFVEVPGDCDDTDDDTHPDAQELCDGHDRDCDGRIDNHCETTHTGDDAFWTSSPATGISPRIVAGDLNDDGVDDLLIGDFLNDRLTLHSGPLVAGETSPDWTIDETGLSTLFSLAVTADVDFNGDGSHDLVVSRLHSTDSGGSFGKIQIHWGPFTGAPDLDDPSVVLTLPETETTWAWGGFEVADFDNDGRPDIAMQTSNAGALAIWNHTDINGHLLTQTLRYDDDTLLIGHPPAAGDFNGDGISDMVVAIDSGDSLGLIPGPIVDPADILPTDALSLGDWSLGYGLCLADMDGDGRPEVISNATILTDGDAFENKVVAFDTEISLTTPTWALATGERRSATSVTCIDADGDGRADIVVNDAHNAIFGGDYTGRALLYFGAFSGTVELSDADHIFAPTDAGISFGMSVVSGDFDGDGLRDLAFGTENPSAHVFSIADWYSSAWTPVD